jgi:Fe-S-cluster containining protein
MEKHQFLCARCARYMATCCQTSEIYITPGDAQRIAEHTGGGDFYEFRPPENPVYLQQDDDPIWSETVFKRPDGTRRVLRRKENGDCAFLGEAGCRLPLETRPLICRLYPYDYNEHGLYPLLAQGCPQELLRPGHSLLQELAMNEHDAQRWHHQLYQELPLERTADDYRADV